MIPTIQTFPFEMPVFVREHLNFWYGVRSYYLAKSLADMPFQLLMPLSYSMISYTMTGQPLEIRRFGLFCLVNMLSSTVGQSVGLLVGTLFEMYVAYFIGQFAFFPNIIFSGIFVPFSSIPCATYFHIPNKYQNIYDLYIVLNSNEYFNN